MKKMNPIYSMTGFGRTVGEYNGKRVTVELKSLNSKTLDLNFRIPSYYREKEPEIRAVLSEKFIRGKVDFQMFVELTTTEPKSRINRDIFIAYYNQLSDIYKTIGQNVNNETLASITRFPDVMESQHEELDANEWVAIRAMIDKSLTDCLNFRATEGESLRTDLKMKIARISDLKDQVAPLEPQRKETVRARLQKSIAELGEPERFDANRFEQELIYYIEKLDINEERVRLEQHMKYFLETLDMGGDVGRKLGFISQEIGREINTLGSKANHSEIQKLVVLMKDELEQMKEQVLNIL
jgi:uncharacterized protein (TIGR00255 family)